MITAMRRSLLLAVVAAMFLPGSSAMAAPVKPTSATTPIAAGAEGSATATCGRGHHVAAAGFTNTLREGQSGVILARMVPTPTAVTTGGLNVGGDGSTTATAYCTKTNPVKKKKKKGQTKKGQSAAAAKGKKRKKKKQRKPPVAVSATTPIAGTDETGTATATCPGGTTVRAGGFDTGSSVSAGNIAHPLDLELASPTQLRVRVHNFSATANSVTAIALCGKGPGLTAVEATTALPVGGNGAPATATCPGGRRVAFAGFRSGYEQLGELFISALVRVSDSQAQATGYAVDMGNTVTAIAYCEPA
jgi:hypothetical protein